MKFAYFVFPHAGGTYTVYSALRAGLASHGITVTWIGVGPHAQAAWDNPQWAHARAHGAVVAGHIEDERQQAEALIRHLEASDFDGVFVNVLGDRVETNAMRYLDPAIRRVMIVHNITAGTYAAARAMREHVHATVGVSPRIQSDLVRKHGFAAERTFAIPNAIDLAPFSSAVRTQSPDGVLRLLFLGRVIDSDKGVLWLPRIMERLANQPVSLTIAGDGPDLAELQKRFANQSGRVRFTGRVQPYAVPALIAEHDVLVFPSRFEGLGLSLVEAMATGCVPVASRIRGVTDFVVHDGSNGCLFDIGNVDAAAAKIKLLAENHELLGEMAAAARRNTVGRFDLPTMANGYAKILGDLAAAPPRIASPLRIDRWTYPPGLRAGLRTYLPNGIKNRLRVWREQFAL